MRAWLKWTSRLRELPPPERTEERTIPVLGIEEIETAALCLPESERARLIRKLLETTADTPDEEAVPIGAEEITPADVVEAQRLSVEGESPQSGDSRPVDDLLREARAKLKGFTRPRRPEPPA